LPITASNPPRDGNMSISFQANGGCGHFARLISWFGPRVGSHLLMFNFHHGPVFY